MPIKKHKMNQTNFVDLPRTVVGGSRRLSYSGHSIAGVAKSMTFWERVAFLARYADAHAELLKKKGKRKRKR